MRTQCFKPTHQLVLQRVTSLLQRRATVDRHAAVKHSIRPAAIDIQAVEC